MRRIRKVVIKPVKISVDRSFYNELNKYRDKLIIQVKNRAGVDKNIPMTKVTHLMVKNGVKFPEINLWRANEKQKRGC